MKNKSFKFNTTHALILLGILFLSSVLYLFLSQRGNRSGRFEYFTTKQYTVEYYYINGCPHCVAFDPVWKNVSENAELNSKIDFKKLEISSNQDRASKFNISSAPTIIVVKKNDDMKIASAPSESRSEAAFTAFVKRYV